MGLNIGRILRLCKDRWLVRSGEHTFVLVLYNLKDFRILHQTSLKTFVVKYLQAKMVPELPTSQLRFPSKNFKANSGSFVKPTCMLLS